jgi:hypothetical protein
MNDIIELVKRQRLTEDETMIGRILMTGCMLLLWSVTTHAQTISRWGFFGGITFSDQDITTDIQGFRLERQTGFHAGGYMEWPIISSFSVVTDLAYVQKGAGQKWEEITYEYPLGTGEFVTHNARLDYFSLSVRGKAALPGTVISPYVTAGPRLDYLLDYQSHDYLSLAGYYRQFDKIVLGTTVSAGLQSSTLLPVFCFVEFRYDIDLTNSFARDNDIGSIEIRNISYSVSAGIGL